MKAFLIAGVLLLAVWCLFGIVKAEEAAAVAVEKTSEPETPGFMLFRSPIQPGGTWGLNLNLKNAWEEAKAVVSEKAANAEEAAKNAVARNNKFLSQYAYVLAESDPAFVKLKGDDSATWTKADKEFYHAETWKEAVDAMRKRLFEIYIVRLRVDYELWVATGESSLLPLPQNSKAHSD